MIKKYLFFYIIIITLPLMLALVVWQSNRCISLGRDIQRLTEAQIEWIDSNKRLIAAIAENSSPERIEKIAVNELRLHKIRPEDVLQIKIVEEKRGY
jgi:cell division protein FtsL